MQIKAGRWCVLLLLCTSAARTPAAVQESTIAYTDGETELSGTLYFDDALDGRRPAVLVIHEWWGLNDYARSRARQLAALGYVAFAIDMYGAGKVTEHPDEAGAWAGAVTANVKTWRQRALVAYEQLRKHPRVDATRIAAIGYCFGGASVLQLAYSGADVRGVASFHGSLPLPAAADVDAIKGAILVEHGAADTFIPAARVAAFQAALAAGEVDWRMTVHGGARHGFTNPAADRRGMAGLAYNAAADRRSWSALVEFLDEIFAP